MLLIFPVKREMGWSVSYHISNFYATNHPVIKNCKLLADLTRGIVKTDKSFDYSMVER
jgi:hypothetical protein